MSGSGGGRGDGFGSGGATSSSSVARGPDGASTVGGAASGGGTAGAGIGGGAGVADMCDVVQRAPLNSVKGTVSTLNLGQELDVVLDASGPRPVLSVCDRQGSVVGSLTHRGHLLLIQCIGQGRAYVAVVTSIAGAAVELRVQLA